MRPNSAIHTPKRDEEHPCHFYIRVPRGWVTYHGWRTVFSLTWSAATQGYWIKRTFLHKNKVQLILLFVYPYGGRDATWKCSICEVTLSFSYRCRHNFQVAVQRKVNLLSKNNETSHQFSLNNRSRRNLRESSLVIKRAVSRNSAKLGNYKMPVKLGETKKNRSKL